MVTIRAYLFNAMVQKPVKFDDPPVVEVVCGIQFDELTEWHSHHFGLFWQTLATEFPGVEDKPPLPSAKEMPLGPAPPPRFEQLESFLPRVWFHSADRDSMLQLQADRFLFNWRKSKTKNDYPSFAVVKKQFDKQLNKFKTFLSENSFRPLVPNQYEVTYVNHIGPKNGFTQFGNDELFTDHRRHNDKDRFLPNTESIDLRWTYELPKGWGRLTVRALTAFLPDEKNEKILRLDVTARGWPGGTGDDERDAWFDTAHDWITRGFADMTRPETHKVWKRVS